MAVTQPKRCHENDEAASVRRVWCRVGSEASLKQEVAQIVTELQVTMYIRSVHCSLCTDVEAVVVVSQRIGIHHDKSSQPL